MAGDLVAILVVLYRLAILIEHRFGWWVMAMIVTVPAAVGAAHDNGPSALIQGPSEALLGAGQSREREERRGLGRDFAERDELPGGGSSGALRNGGRR